MHIVSIEPTPSPHTMKITLSVGLGNGKSEHYKKEDVDDAPVWLQPILSIEGVKAVYHVADFLALDRVPSYDWKPVLAKVRALFGEEDEEHAVTEVKETFGEVRVHVQKFSGIPMQLKLSDGETEQRIALPQAFTDAVMQAQMDQENVVFERSWEEYGVRYGALEDVGATLVEELVALYPNERLKALQEGQASETESHYHTVTLDDLNSPDWKVRLRKLEYMKEPTVEDLPVLEKALQDEKASIRRYAVMYFGMIEDVRVLPYLEKALKDSSVTVRRTAGDAMSDLGMTDAMPAMADALQDSNKIVRWRAAMFLYEVGDASVLPQLKEAANDPEFEVSLQIQLAIERIAEGKEAKGSIWKQMTEAVSKDSK
ncbi:conserved virulence factor C family protein [Aureibacillus halotolerans]|uniref:HEAT repeat protein n=1 Tax=Aureibacillus halotolerans TaxID=1508390 RepID=A0A4R6UEF2_9BACI|nr:conserved virulence factor C family protein [Aureibacillus halotolerans]TDQ41464.1 HEAT repeat protein [Aureibacillus halotolerans]